ncbi:MAG: tyrosyl-DNA phosphodiesterase 1 [Gemmataceae bacterium]
MSSAEFGWESLLHTDAPQECKLQAALFNTYDRADEIFLAEHLLPLLLKLGHESESEGAERQYFLIELDERLKKLHDRLVVVSSTTREEPRDTEEGESGTYGWLWHSIRHLTVGSRGKAVQHAKLWLLHWGPKQKDADGGGYLEIVISSANLTRAAFKSQLQAAWRTCIELHPKPSEARLQRWGVFPHFLRELAVSAGEDERLDNFVELLARADCPEGVTFVASVPGKHSRQVLRRTPWGAAGLREIMPAGRGTVSVAILTPFVGTWNANALNRWCAAFGGSPDHLSLVWIDNDHPWARDKKWLLPEATLKTLTELDATLLHLRHEPEDYVKTDFHPEHRQVDPQWSHAKVYSLRRGASRRLLVTSANFSPAAWGWQNDNGELTIENFELGVCVEQGMWPFGNLKSFDSIQDAAVSEAAPRGSTLILWARAVWDGKRIDVACRCDAKGDLKGKIRSGDDWTSITNWTAGASGLRSARVQWTDSTRPPLLVQLTCEQEQVCEQERVRVPVFDERPSRDRDGTLPPELDGDQEVVQRMRDELLFEQYGGRVADDAEGKGTSNGNGNGPIPPDDYSVPAFDLARQHLGVVDNWAERVKQITARGRAEFERELLRRDGELLREAFQRREKRDREKGEEWASGAKLAAEELALRLKHFPEA